jgi:predicted nuclease of predicted toxin-antitoxin system
MRLLLDQDIWDITAQFLEEAGYDVVPVDQLGLARAKDSDLLQIAQNLGRIFITRDRDFGGLVFVEKLGAGVLYLRILPSTQQAVHRELARVLAQYSTEELLSAFVVIEANGHRFRRPGK